MGELYLQLHAWQNNRALIGLNSSIHTPEMEAGRLKRHLDLEILLIVVIRHNTVFFRDSKHVVAFGGYVKALALGIGGSACTFNGSIYGLCRFSLRLSATCYVLGLHLMIIYIIYKFVDFFN